MCPDEEYIVDISHPDRGFLIPKVPKSLFFRSICALGKKNSLLGSSLERLRLELFYRVLVIARSLDSFSQLSFF